MPDEIPKLQNQTQSQSNSLQVTIQSSSDPALERRIFGKVASAGKQLGRIAHVLDILIGAYERDPNTVQDANAIAAIAAFRSMQADIASEKNARSPERIIEALEELRAEDGKAYVALLPRLRQWLAQQPADAASPPQGGDFNAFR